MLTSLLVPVLLAAASPGVGGDGLPVRAPAAVGMSAERLETIDRVVERGVAAGGYPGAAVVVGRRGAAAWMKGYGRLAWGGESPRVSPTETLYDLASLTKVVATTTMAMVLYDEGRLHLDDRVQDILPGFAGGRWKDEVTVRQLLTHRAGLPAGRDLWRKGATPDAARQMVLEAPLEYRPGTGYIYSDLGADLLGMVCEALADEGMDTFLQRRVFGPLGMNDTKFRPSAYDRDRTAPTEVAPPRGYPLQGEVHDENAYALGGVAGHAGLFGTAGDLAVFAQMMLNGGRYNGVRVVSDSTVALFTRRAAGSRALGWEMAEGRHGAGDYLSPEAYGHVGFTGTSLWIDPARDMFVVLLTNRVHAARARRPAKVIADVRSDLSDAAALAVMDDGLRVAAMPAVFRADQATDWNRPLRSRSARRGRSARSKAAAKTTVKTTVRKGSTKSTTKGATKGATTGATTKAGVKKTAAKKSGAAKSGTTAGTRPLKKR